MLRQLAHGLVRNLVDDKPIWIGKGIIVVPGLAGFIEKLPFTRCHFGQQLIGYNGLEKLTAIRVQQRQSLSIDDKKLAMHWRFHLAQRMAHRRQIKMERQRPLEFTIRRDNRFGQGYGLLFGEEISIGLGVAAEDSNITLVNKPRAASGIEGMDVGTLYRLRSSKVVA